MIIDTHAHTVPGTLLEAMRAEKRLFPTVRLNDDGAMPRIDFGAGPGRPIQPRLFDLGQRRDWLKQARVDRQLVGGWTDVYGYDLAPAEGADWMTNTRSVPFCDTVVVRAPAPAMLKL